MVYTYNDILLSLKKAKKILIHAITRMKPEDILNEKSQSQKDEY